MTTTKKVPVMAIARATKKTFDQGIRLTPVVGDISKKMPISPTTTIFVILALGLLTGGLWFASKALILGGIAFHTWFVNKSTKSNITKKTAICAGLLAAFFYL